MKKLFTRSFVRALIITAVSALIIAGGIYAYETLWSGKAGITIEPTEGEGQLEVIDVSVTKGTWNDGTNTWTVCLNKLDEEFLTVTVENTGSAAVRVDSSVSDRYPATGVLVKALNLWDNVAAGATKDIMFGIYIGADASPGEVPEVQLELRTD